MKIHCLQHASFEGLGSIQDWVHTRSHALAVTRLFRGEPLPPVEQVRLLVVLGGPMSVHDEARYPWLAGEKRFIERVAAAGGHVLGLCLGAQLIACVLGAQVRANREKEIGWFPVETTPAARATALFGAFPQRILAFHWHGETFDIPAGALHVARNDGCTNQAYVYDERLVGLQFHLEMTPSGARQLIAECGAEMVVVGRCIQQPLAMLGHPHRFDEINIAMRELLDRLSQAATSARHLAGMT